MERFPHVEHMIVPHRLQRELRGDDSTPQFLLATINPEMIREDIFSIEDPQEREETILVAADIICNQARAAVWYPEGNDFEALDIEDEMPLSLDLLAEKQVARCFGFVITASECLEASGIEHWIGFANGHSTILLPMEGGERVHLVDPLSPELSQKLDLVTASGEAIGTDLKQHGKSAIELNGVKLANNSQSNDLLDTLNQHPWLTFKQGKMAGSLAVDQGFGLDPDSPKNKILMSIYEAPEGRNLLKTYNKFEIALRDKDFDEAALFLNRLAGKFPEIDARKQHREAKEVVKELCRNQQVKRAKGLIDGYFASFVLMEDDSRFIEAKGDCLRLVGKEGQDTGAAIEAVKAYDKVINEYPGHYKSVEQKRAKAVELCRQLNDLQSAA